MNCSRKSEAVLMKNVRSCVPPSAHLFCRMSPLGLKQFTETTHVAELANQAPVLYAVLSSAVGKNPTMKKNLVNVQEPNTTSEQCTKIVPPIGMASSILLKSRCPQMSAQAYRLSTVYGIVEQRNRLVN